MLSTQRNHPRLVDYGTLGQEHHPAGRDRPTCVYCPPSCRRQVLLFFDLARYHGRLGTDAAEKKVNAGPVSRVPPQIDHKYERSGPKWKLSEFSMSLSTLSHDVLRTNNCLFRLINSNILIRLVTSELTQSFDYSHLCSKVTAYYPKSVIKL